MSKIKILHYMIAVLDNRASTNESAPTKHHINEAVNRFIVTIVSLLIYLFFLFQTDIPEYNIINTFAIFLIDISSLSTIREVIVFAVAILPVFVYNILMFVWPGLYRGEKEKIVPILTLATAIYILLFPVIFLIFLAILISITIIPLTIRDRVVQNSVTTFVSKHLIRIFNIQSNPSEEFANKHSGLNEESYYNLSASDTPVIDTKSIDDKYIKKGGIATVSPERVPKEAYKNSLEQFDKVELNKLEDSLDPISKKHVQSFLEQINEEDVYLMGIVLPNGKKIFIQSYIIKDESCVVYFAREGIEYNLTFQTEIPYSDICGIFPIKFQIREKKEKAPAGVLDGWKSNSASFSPYHALLDHNIKVLEESRYDYDLIRATSFSRIGTGEEITWDILDKSETLLYADIEYFKNIGKVNQFGISAFGFGISIGQDRNVVRLAEKALSKDNVEISKVINHNTATFAGYAYFLEGDSEQIDLTDEMENKTWVPCVVTKTRLPESDETCGKNTEIKCSWILCLFAETGFQLPEQLLYSIDNAVKIYADVVDVSADTEFGQSECVAKVRAMKTIPASTQNEEADVND